MAFDIDQALTYMVEREGSDLHLKADSPPVARVHGDLWAAPGLHAADARGHRGRVRARSPRTSTIRKEFAEDGEADFSYEIPGVSRFRVNAFRQRGSVSLVCRAIPFQVRTIDDLGLPQVVSRLADEPRGIILLTGTTGSGKSTTLAAMVDQINSNKAAPHRHARGPDRVPAQRQALDHQPARGRAPTPRASRAR